MTPKDSGKILPVIFFGAKNGIKVLEWDFKDYYSRWFIGGKLNITENCLDRHLGMLGSTPAIIWEPNDPEEHHRILTYRELYNKVIQFANVLKNNGVQKGDRVCLYMGWFPNWLLLFSPVQGWAPFIL
jgi:acetyl-CoA synthetase